MINDHTSQEVLRQEQQTDKKPYLPLFYASQEPMLLLNRDHRFVDCNDATVQLLGAGSKSEILHLHPAAISPPYQADGQSSAAKADALLEQANAGGPLRFEWLHCRLDGSEFIVDVALTPVHVQSSQLMLVQWRDVSERHTALAQLRASEERFRSAFVNAPIGMALVNLDGHFFQVNSAFCSMLRYTEAELLDKTFQDITYPPDRPIGGDHFMRAVRGEISHISFAKRYLRRDGELVNVVVTSSIVRDQNGAPLHFVSHIQDVTESTRAETALRESEDKYRQLFELESDAITLINSRNGDILEVNSAACALYGYSRDELLQMRNVDLSAEPARTRKATLDEVSLVPVRWQRKKDGTAFPVEITASHFDWRGYRVHIAAMRDITTRLRAEKALRASQANLTALIENTDSLIWSVDTEYRLLACNSVFLDFNERFNDAVLEVGSSLLYGGLDDATKEAWQTAYDRTLAGEKFRMEFRSRFISPHSYFECFFNPIYDAAGNITGLTAMARDITERRDAERARMQQRVLAEALRETAAALNSTLEFDEVLDHILSAVERVVPHDAANVSLIDGAGVARIVRSHGYAGLSEPIETLRFSLPVQGAPVLRSMAETAEPAIISDTRSDPAWTPTPETVWVQSYAGVPITYQDRVTGFLSLDSKTPGFFTSEHTERLRIFADQVATAFENARLYEQVQQHAVRLEERVAERTRELMDANRRLTELDRMKDAFVARVSHELRTPLANIKLYVALLDKGKPEKRHPYMRVLERETDQLQHMIEDLLAISRLDIDAVATPLEAVDLNRLVATIVAAHQDRATENGLSLIIETAAAPAVPSDAGLVAQAVNNLIDNALSYTPAGGTITVRCAPEVVDGQPGVSISVGDSGPGITESDRPHIFRRFYRGEAARNYKVAGAGLGLATCRAAGLSWRVSPATARRL